MKKRIMIVCAVFSILLLVTTKISFGRNHPLTEYDLLQKEVANTFTDEELDKDMFIGKEISITKREFLQTRNMFLANGYSEEEAIQATEKELKEYNALCAEALKNGYQVTDEEIDRYLEELKKMTETAENAEDIKQYIKTFGSEEAFWSEMKNVYRKRRPAELFVKDLEKEFAQKSGLAQGTEAFYEKWEKEFEIIKSNAVKAQAFQPADSGAKNE